MPSLPNELWWSVLAHAVPFGGDLAMVKSSSEQLHPFFQGSSSGFSDAHFVSTQFALWKRRNITVLNLMRVNRLWRGLAEPFLYSALYVVQEWRLRKFIDNIKENPRQAEQLRTLVVMPRFCTKDLTMPFCDRLVVQVLGLCHGVTAVVVESHLLSSPLSLFQSPDSRRLRLLSALCLQNGEFSTFMVNFGNYASLQVLELSVNNVEGDALSSFPEHITLPSLHTLILGYLNPLALVIVRKWELPSLKELAIPRWNPILSMALIPLIQQSYERLERLDTCTDPFHDRSLYDIIRTPLIHLKNLTLGIAYSTSRSPPTQLAVKPVFCHVVTLGICRIEWIMPEDMHAWIQFISDPTYMPHLRSVWTDISNGRLELCLQASLPLLDVLRSFEEVLQARGVAFKGVTNDRSSFVPIKLLQRDSLEDDNDHL